MRHPVQQPDIRIWASLRPLLCTKMQAAYLARAVGQMGGQTQSSRGKRRFATAPRTPESEAVKKKA